MSCQTEVKQQTEKSPSAVEKQVSSKRALLESDVEYANKLTRVGEILVNNPVGFTHANDMFNRALILDPQNNKALFYSAFTEIMMTMKGSLNRTKGLMDDPADYNKVIDYVTKELKYPEFVDFIAGKKTQSKFKNYQEIKRFLQNDVVDAFENGNKKLNKINGDVNLILTQLETENTELKYNCVESVDELGDSETVCDLKSEMDNIVALPAKTVQIDIKDINILASGLKGYSTIFKLYTAYAITGQKHITNEVKVKELELGRDLTDKELNRIVSDYGSYLVLEKDHRMNEVVRDLEDIVAVGMDLETLNNQFCDNDLRDNNLIKTICFSDTARVDMQKSLDYLAGPQEMTMGQDSNGDDVKIVVDLPTYLSNPVSDLKTLMPTEYDIDGASNYTVEPQLNGLFPNKDLLDTLNKIK
jgi:hypothetical protein